MNTIPAPRISGIGVDNPACYTMAVAGYSYTAMAGVTKAPLSAEMTTGGFYFGGPGCL